jgi:hypothetical protein
MMLNYVYYYDYIKNVLAAYLSKRKIVQLSATEFDLILNKIDRELFKSNADQLIYNALKSIGDFFNIGRLDKSKVSPIAVEILLKEKNLVNYLLKLRRAIPVTEGAKKEYHIEDIQRVLFSTTSVEPETDETEVEEKLGSDKQEESILFNEETVKEVAKDHDEETEEFTDEIEKVNDEESEDKTLGQLADDHAAELEKADMSDLLNSEEEKLMEMYEKELKELDDESLGESAIDETSFEELLEEITEENIENSITEDTDSDNIFGEKDELEEQKLETESNDKHSTEAEKVAEATEGTNDLSAEEEIVTEMIDDYFGNPPEDENLKEGITDEAEISETSSAGEKETDEETFLDDVKGELEISQEPDSLEDELLEVFEELDEIKKDALKTENFAEPEQDEINDLEEDLSEATSTEVNVGGEFLDEEELSEIDSIDGDLQTVDETAFTDDEETSDDFKDEPGKNNDADLDEINKELYQFDGETEEQEEEEKPGEEIIRRKNDLFSYLKGKEIKKITNSIFGGDEMDFVSTIEKISECATYKEATEILKGLFFSYKISPFAKEAVMFTNAVSNYFRQV